MSIKQSIAETMRIHRAKSGLSQDKLAARADISTRHYQAIEAGDKQPTLETLFKLSKALDQDFATTLSPIWQEWLTSCHQEDTKK